MPAVVQMSSCTKPPGDSATPNQHQAARRNNSQARRAAPFLHRPHLFEGALRGAPAVLSVRAAYPACRTPLPLGGSSLKIATPGFPPVNFRVAVGGARPNPSLQRTRFARR